jgi:hypothetical protein
MSALGHKQTFAVQHVMSALPPTATAKADFGKPSCLLYPRKQTSAVHWPMSAKGQKRTLPTSLDHLISASEQRRRHCEAKRFRCLQIDYEFKFCWSLHRKIAGPLAL